MITMDAVKTSVYKLGRVAFSVKNCDEGFTEDLDVLLPHASETEYEDIDIHDVKMGCERDLRGLLNHILKKHLGCLWIDAGCLITPAGKKILISGQSGAGKSTTTMALALGYGWKVVAEDLLLLDKEQDMLLTFASPFSLKSGTFEMLKECVGRGPDPILQSEWSPLGEMAASGTFDAHFDFSIVLNRAVDGEPNLVLDEVSPIEYLRSILPISNTLRYKDASEKMIEYFSSGRCVRFSGGTLRERLDTILDLCK